MNSVLAVNNPVHLQSSYFFAQRVHRSGTMCKESTNIHIYRGPLDVHDVCMRSELFGVLIVSCTKGPYIYDAHTKRKKGYELCDDE